MSILQVASKVIADILPTEWDMQLTTTNIEIVYYHLKVLFHLGKAHLVASLELERMINTSYYTNHQIEIEVEQSMKVIDSLSHDRSISQSHAFHTFQNTLLPALTRLSNVKDGSQVWAGYEQQLLYNISQYITTYDASHRDDDDDGSGSGGGDVDRDGKGRGGRRDAAMVFSLYHICESYTASNDNTLKQLNIRVYLHQLIAESCVIISNFLFDQSIERKVGYMNLKYFQLSESIDKKADVDKDDDKDENSGNEDKHDHNTGNSNSIKTTSIPTATSTHSNNNSISRSDSMDISSSKDSQQQQLTHYSSAHTLSADRELKAAVEREYQSNLDTKVKQLYPLLLHTGKHNIIDRQHDVEYMKHQAEHVELIYNDRNVANVYKAYFKLQSEEDTEGNTKRSRKLFRLTINNDQCSDHIAILRYWTQCQIHLQLAINTYHSLHGVSSVLAADTMILLGNLYRSFSRVDEARVLYEEALKVYKFHAAFKYKLPLAEHAHCWLGLASCFSSSYNRDDIILRLFTESYLLYKSIFLEDHYTVTQTMQCMVPLYISEQLFVDGVVALTAIVDAAREKKHMLLQMYRYFVGQLRSVAKHHHSPSQKHRVKTQQSKISAEYTRLRASVYLYEQMLSLTNKNTCYWLVSLAQLYNYCKKHRQAVPLLKESIMLLREVRLNVLKVMRHHKNSIKMKASTADAVVSVKAINDSGDNNAVATAQNSDSNGDAGIEKDEKNKEEDEVLVNAVERQLSFQTADVMIMLSQSVFEEGKRVLGKRAKGLALPEHQFRYAMHLMNRAMDLYGAYELVMDNGKLIKEALRLKAKMSVEQGDYATAARCYDTINKLYMTIRFDDYKEVALYHFEHGKILLQAKEYNDAALLFQQSVEIYRNTYGVDHLDVRIAEGLLLRGEAYLHLKAYDYAEPPLDDALKMLSVIYLPEEASQSELLATCHGHLGAIYHYYEEYEQALEAYNNSVTIYGNNADMSSSLKLANICNNLGTLLDDMVRCTCGVDGWMDRWL